jgi:hypothetical protein
MKDFSFQGKFGLYDRQASGKPGRGRWVDDAAGLKVNLKQDSEKRQESYTGQKLTTVVLQKAKEADFEIELNAGSAANFALALQASQNDVAAGTVTGELLPSGILAGDWVSLEHPRISSLVLTDNAAIPATLEEGQHYRIDSAAGGSLEFLDVAGLTQPFSAAYAHGAYINLACFNVPAVTKYGILDGINTVDNERVRVRLYKMQFDPVTGLDLINNGLSSIKLKGSLLYDVLNAADANLGGFAGVQLPPAEG